MLDGRGEPDSGDEKEGRTDKDKKSRSDRVAEHEDGEDEEDEDENYEDEDDMEEDETKDAFVPSDNEQQSDEAALDDLDAFVSKLDVGKKRKAEDESDGPAADSVAPTRKRRMLKARTEAGVESEFGVPAASG